MRIYITGATGFLGRNLIPMLRNDHELYCPGRSITPLAAMDFRPEVVIALAGRLGPSADIQQERRWDFYRDNLLPHLDLLSAIPGSSVKHLIVAGTYGCYSAETILPFRSTEILCGRLPPTSYGAGKQAALVATYMMRHQHYIPVSYLILANIYGPGQQEHRVIPSLMRKVPRGEVLRGTGEGSREFLHVRDAARAIVAAVQSRQDAIVNVGTGVETFIRDLACRFGEPKFDGDCSVNSRMVMAPDRVEGWEPAISLEQGIAELMPLRLEDAHGRV